MGSKEFRILSYNIHKGFTSANTKFVLKDVRQTINEVQADILFLQEVVGANSKKGRRHKNWPTMSQFEYLAGEIWPHYAYGKNAVYSSGHHGNAILSKYPITFWENVDVSHNRFERRGLLHGVIEIPKYGPLHVICLHFALFETWREPQIEILCSRIGSHVPPNAPLIIAGDFNDWREQASIELGKRLGVGEVFQTKFGTHAKTFPAWFPLLKLDRVYSRGLQINDAVCFNEGPWKVLSDHAPLCVDFVLS
jgi:endonuclease/exonuclease/phosphatase family metal-dependent hydrolase